MNDGDQLNWRKGLSCASGTLHLFVHSRTHARVRCAVNAVAMLSYQTTEYSFSRYFFVFIFNINSQICYRIDHHTFHKYVCGHGGCSVTYGCAVGEHRQPIPSPCLATSISKGERIHWRLMSDDRMQEWRNFAPVTANRVWFLLSTTSSSVS